MSPVCCFRDCEEDERASLRVEITPPPDGAPILVRGHEACFRRLRDPSVHHDDPRDHGRIPAGARCVFCGKPLPIIGRHPFVFDVGDSPARRFWAHADCMADRFVIEELGTST